MAGGGGIKDNDIIVLGFDESEEKIKGQRLVQAGEHHVVSGHIKFLVDPQGLQRICQGFRQFGGKLGHGLARIHLHGP